jgi:PEP-CTERM motif
MDMRLFKNLAGGTSSFGRRSLVYSVLALVALASAASAAPLAGLTFVPEGTSQPPGLTSANPGTLLAFMDSPYSFFTTAGLTSGDLLSAVYRNPSGTLDFYYQVKNSASSATAIARESDTSFTSVAANALFAGFRIDGGSLLGTTFSNGSVAPVTVDRSLLGPGSTVGFNFNPPETAKILPGLASNVLVISTDATTFGGGNAQIIDGGTQTVAAFQPAPEPASFALLGLGLLAIGGIGRKLKGRS